MVIVLRKGAISIAYDDGTEDVYIVDPEHEWVASTRWIRDVAKVEVMPDSIKEISKDVAFMLHASGYEFFGMDTEELDAYFEEE